MVVNISQQYIIPSFYTAQPVASAGMSVNSMKAYMDLNLYHVAFIFIGGLLFVHYCQFYGNEDLFIPINFSHR